MTAPPPHGDAPDARADDHADDHAADDADVARLVADFEACTLAAGALHHREHVQVAWWLLRHEPALTAMARFVEALRRYAAHLGKAGLYHETISWAYLLVINERLERGGRDRSWADFARAEADLFTPALLARYYRPETLASPLARRVFVLPDAGA
jgi:hypothetical protein